VCGQHNFAITGTGGLTGTVAILPSSIHHRTVCCRYGIVIRVVVVVAYVVRRRRRYSVLPGQFHRVDGAAAGTGDRLADVGAGAGGRSRRAAVRDRRPVRRRRRSVGHRRR